MTNRKRPEGGEGDGRRATSTNKGKENHFRYEINFLLPFCSSTLEEMPPRSASHETDTQINSPSTNGRTTSRRDERRLLLLLHERSKMLLLQKKLLLLLFEQLTHLLLLLQDLGQQRRRSVKSRRAAMVQRTARKTARRAIRDFLVRLPAVENSKTSARISPRDRATGTAFPARSGGPATTLVRARRTRRRRGRSTTAPFRSP